jgi:hypothetical protein
MAAHKEYSGTLKLGEGTDSLDAELEVTERLPWEHLTGVMRARGAAKVGVCLTRAALRVAPGPGVCVPRPEAGPPMRCSWVTARTQPHTSRRRDASHPCHAPTPTSHR